MVHNLVPTLLDEVLRDLDHRVRLLETVPSARVGDWVLATDDAGNLVAVHGPTGTTVTLAVPPP